MTRPADSETVRPSKLEAEVYALDRAEVRKSLDGTGWLRLYRAVAEQDEFKLVELLEEAEEAYLTAFRAGEVAQSSRWSSWYVNHMLGGRS